MTHVNDTTVHDDVHVAFGGEKQSGLGRFGGDWVLETSPPSTGSASSTSPGRCPTEWVDLWERNLP